MYGIRVGLASVDPPYSSTSGLHWRAHRLYGQVRLKSSCAYYVLRTRTIDGFPAVAEVTIILSILYSSRLPGDGSYRKQS